MIEWAYGITTTPSRLKTLLPRTLDSLAAAGFASPRLFVDGPDRADSPLPTTYHDPPVGAFCNWLCGAWELHSMFPTAMRYAIFEDDIVLCRNIRQYLEKCPYPKEQGYYNLLTFASNEAMIFKQPTGWHRSDQQGRGAVALVFPHDVMVLILQQFFSYKPQVYKERFQNTDGAVQHAAVRMSNLVEYVHSPSLVQHVGVKSTLGNNKHPLAKTFPGESYDAMELIHED